ncbi:MAG TPA: hypothetical protein VL021_04190 [Brumimicrobium sp.]|nr:hypothetical protein [Brumimicrobium sp.]
MNKIYVAPNKLKNKVYKEFKKHCEEHGFVKENSLELSLLVPAGTPVCKEELHKLVERFLEGHEAIIVIEPVTKLTDCLLRAGYKQYSDDLPQYHVHILIKDENIHVGKLKEKWFELVGASKKRLFHCEPIRKEILDYLHYITKFFEDKYDAKPIYSFLIKKEEEQKKEVEICHDEPATIFSLLKRTAAALVKKIKTSRLFSKLFVSTILILTLSTAFEDQSQFTPKAHSPPKNVSNKGLLN